MNVYHRFLVKKDTQYIVLNIGNSLRSGDRPTTNMQQWQWNLEYCSFLGIKNWKDWGRIRNHDDHVEEVFTENDASFFSCPVCIGNNENWVMMFLLWLRSYPSHHLLSLSFNLNVTTAHGNIQWLIPVIWMGKDLALI